ncbi:MAG TPA: hypothetical protein VK660_10745 [Xanthomonadaceae bacterium]|jgi:hypothetical protein|nr:hypothetical protein [Xanthomonadaceae bacterium]
MQRTLLSILAATTCALAISAAQPAAAADADLSCKLHYNLTGWSLIYKHTTGTGTVTCANGHSMRVHLVAKAVGLTVGKWKIEDGKGDFTHVFHMHDVLGKYAQASANAGVVKSGEAQVLTKGEVSLGLAGNGQGMDLGVDVGEFTISE